MQRHADYQNRSSDDGKRATNVKERGYAISAIEAGAA